MNVGNSHINWQIGNYRVMSELSSGAFGRVYLAQHTLLTQRAVAIKVLHATHLASPEEHADFLQEAQFLEKLKHPYILPILDVGIIEGFPYLVEEYAPNGSLRDRIKRSAPNLLPLEESLAILSQVGQALQYAHEQQIIHRDIKPENILFNAKNEALLADFGLATTLSTSSVKHVDSSGTPRYMAPDQFQGNVSKESDQYSLACIAYELVTGRPPFTDTDYLTIGIHHLTENPIPPTQLNPSLPAAIDEVILKAMAKQRANRYSDVSSFIFALLQAINSHVYHGLTSNSMPTLLISNGKDTPTPVQGWISDPMKERLSEPGSPLPTISSANMNRTQSVKLSQPGLGSIQPTSSGITENEQGVRDLENDVPFLYTNNWTASQHTPTTKPHSGYRRLILAVVLLAISASILAGMLLVVPSFLAPHTTSNIAASSLQTKGTIPPGTTSGSTHTPSKQSSPSGKPTGQPGQSLTPQSSPQSGAQPTPGVSSTTQPGTTPTSPSSTPQPTPTTPPPTPTPTTPAPITDTLTVDFANPNGTQTTNSYSGSVTVTISGSGGVAPSGWSDAFYQYYDFYGNAINPPQHSPCYVMYINGTRTDGLVSTPAYNPGHVYQFTMNASGGTLNFSICDHKYGDNHGSLSVTITQNGSSANSSSSMGGLSMNIILSDMITEEDKKVQQL